MGRYNLDGYVPSVFVSFSKGVHVDSPDLSAVFTPFLGLQRAPLRFGVISALRVSVHPRSRNAEEDESDASLFACMSSSAAQSSSLGAGTSLRSCCRSARST